MNDSRESPLAERGSRLLRTALAPIVAIACLALIPATARAATPPSTTIAGAQELPASSTSGATESGGGQDVDFWTVYLVGGEQLRLNLSNNANAEDFDLFAPSTTAQTFTLNPPVSSASSSNGSIYGANSSVTLQAPYSGTFLLAVCQP